MTGKEQSSSVSHNCWLEYSLLLTESE